MKETSKTRKQASKSSRMSVNNKKIQDLNRCFLEFMGKQENVEAANKEIYKDLLEEVLMGFVFDVHRMSKTGSSDVKEGIPDDESYAIVGLQHYARMKETFKTRNRLRWLQAKLHQLKDINWKRLDYDLPRRLYNTKGF